MLLSKGDVKLRQTNLKKINITLRATLAGANEAVTRFADVERLLVDQFGTPSGELKTSIEQFKACLTQNISTAAQRGTTAPIVDNAFQVNPWGQQIVADSVNQKDPIED